MTVQEDYDRKQIKIISEGDVYCCGEYVACEYLIDAMSITNLELGLRWLHDREYEEYICWDSYIAGVQAGLIQGRINSIELGLRWLHDRAFWTGMHRTGDICYICGKYIDIEQEIDSLELGLRWLHDRAYESLYANSPRWNVLTLRAICYIELGLRWLHDRTLETRDKGKGYWGGYFARHQ